MKTVNHLGTDPIGKLVPRIAFPSMLAQFVSVLYSIVDRMYIGHIASVGDLARSPPSSGSAAHRCSASGSERKMKKRHPASWLMRF